MDAGRAGALAAAKADGGRAGSRGHPPLHERIRLAAQACTDNAAFRLLAVLVSWDGDGTGVRRGERAIAAVCGRGNGFVTPQLRKLEKLGFVEIVKSKPNTRRSIRIRYDEIQRLATAPAIRCTHAPGNQCTYAPSGRCTYAPGERCTNRTMEHRNNAREARERCEAAGFTTDGWTDADCIARAGTLPQTGDP